MADRPDNVQYTKTHEWIRIEGGVATVGITDFAVQHLGDLVFVDLPSKGADIEVGTAVAEIESVKAVGEVYAPIGGEVVEVNGDLSADQSSLASDPFGAGWLFKVQIAGEPAAGLMDRGSYEAQLES
ncbi:MAG: glycine cleavage system protein GcvH [Planctomycetota bacterium]|nr:glycine cleavage system protein GcvH [Planctomycetota bacterium]